MKKILIVEDDLNLNNSLQKICEGEGFQTETALTLKRARELLTPLVDVVILDWMLPDGQGIDLLREIRSLRADLPVIMLTSRSDLVDKVVGLETGANDYMTKPFESRELIARLRVQLREKPLTPQSVDVLRSGELVLRVQDREFLFKGERIVFTKMEFELMKLLLENPRQTFSRENLLDKVWGYENYPTTRTVDTHVLQIRQKTHESVIETIRGLGYRLGIDKELTKT